MNSKFRLGKTTMSTERVSYKTDKIMPTPAQLAEMGRELQFYPSISKNPNVLTTHQVSDFNRVGYISGLWGNPPRPTTD